MTHLVVALRTPSIFDAQVLVASLGRVQLRQVV